MPRRMIKQSSSREKKPSKATTLAQTKSPDQKFEDSMVKVKTAFGREFPLWIGGKECSAAERFEDCSPINTNWVLAKFPKGTAKEAADALAAARTAFPAWSRMRWQERVRLVRKVIPIIEKRAYDLGAAVALEVGKNRMESLGEAEEFASLVAYYCDAMERNKGFVHFMRRERIKGYKATNISVLRPYGVWIVISPFNFPLELSGGPTAAALVTGNTVVLKPATDTSWAVALLAHCFRDAGLPEGVFNFVTGPGGTLGEALITSTQADGITFTGSYDVGMHIYRAFGAGKYPRPCIAEMGGKNAAIVSRRADLDRAAIGIMRSAFGLQGQKCSACSRIFVEKPVKEALLQKLTDLTNKIGVGDPTRLENWLGPVINRKAYDDYGSYIKELGRAGTILTGGKQLTDGELGQGYFCAPTLVDNVPLHHHLWKDEMFLPIAMIAAVESLDEAMERVNEVNYGLTGGFYGSAKEVAWFFDEIQVGVAIANRPQGATTGGQAGYRPFGGWKASGSTGKSVGGHHYVQQYMHEQTQTVIE